MSKASEFFNKFCRYSPSGDEKTALGCLRSFSLKADKENRAVFCEACFDGVVAQNHLHSLEEGIKKAYVLSEFRFLPAFHGCDFDESYVKELVSLLEIYHGEGYSKGFFDSYKAELSGGELIITLKDGLDPQFLIENKINEFFSQAISARFGREVAVVFDGSPDNGVSSHAEDDLAEKSRLAYAAALEREEANKKTLSSDYFNAGGRSSHSPLEGKSFEVLEGGHVRSGRLVFDVSNPTLLCGRGNFQNLIPIKEISDKTRAFFLGRVFQTDKRESKDGARITYTFGVTDLESSITVRFITSSPAELTMPEENDSVLVCGTPAIDRYDGELKMRASAIFGVSEVFVTDDAEQKRVELHLHTTLSANDALCPPEEVIKTAARRGMTAIAVTDHGSVQAFPEIMKAAEQNPAVKPIYGMEGYLVDDTARAVFGFDETYDRSFSDGVFTVFDIETTGLSPYSSGITEIGAVRYRGGEAIEVFETYVDPGMPIPQNITELTGITDEMVKGAPSMREAVERFIKFAGDTILVAHNAGFDIGFIKKTASDYKIPFSNPYLDTVSLSRYLNPGLSRHNLDAVRKYYGLGEFKHHRASGDCKILCQIFERMIKKMEPDGVTTVGMMISEMASKADPRRQKPYHVTILVQNQIGLKNLYKIVSYSYLNYYYRYPRIPKTVLKEYREGLIVGSACESGEIYQAVLENRPYSEQLSLSSFYDFFEIMPHSNNSFLIDEGRVSGTDELSRINKKIYDLAVKQGKPCVATGDVHFLTEHDEIYRQILKHGQKYSDASRVTGMYLKTTGEMLEEFNYLGREKAFEVVVTNTNKVADMISPDIRPIPKGKFTPDIKGADEELVGSCRQKALELYGETLPDIVKLRMEKELSSIIKHGFAVMYVIAQKLVRNSEEKGYLVGSRGSVGSSFVAHLAGISEVNPLPPHYRCPNCRYCEFPGESAEGKHSAEDGFDLPDKNCPTCGFFMVTDGHDIPFETFLGFKGDKAPDIDLNFSGAIQSEAHKYTEQLFGSENIFRAGTVGTIASKTAYGYVRKYLEDKGLNLTRAEINRLTAGCVGVKRTTGQHPGGIIVIPKEYEIYDFTPVQHPAEREFSEVITTHFAIEHLHDTILKLDMLGHDVPTMYKLLEDYTGIDVRSLPMNDKNVMSLFSSPRALGVKREEIDCETGTLALPEMGTNYVRGMVVAAKPKTFSDLTQISGLSHGTGIWRGNGEDLVKNGTCTISEIISTRDSIMLYLIKRGLDSSVAFEITESVRKGHGVSAGQEKIMLAHGVPEWYISSCRKIKYMFPKAHAVAYVIAALRLAWFKINRPVEFYATHFTAHPEGFDPAVSQRPLGEIRKRLSELKKQENPTQKDADVFSALQIVNEVRTRGICFLPVNLFKSLPFNFVPEDGKIRIPLATLPGLGETVAQNIYKAVGEGVSTVDELKVKAGISKTLLETLRVNGCLDSLPENGQLTLF
ncbi:MAG: PolC-type DNA polymerase III [Eubacteriales bacterium]